MSSIKKIRRLLVASLAVAAALGRHRRTRLQPGARSGISGPMAVFASAARDGYVRLPILHRAWNFNTFAFVQRSPAHAHDSGTLAVIGD